MSKAATAQTTTEPTMADLLKGLELMAGAITSGNKAILEALTVRETPTPTTPAPVAAPAPAPGVPQVSGSVANEVMSWPDQQVKDYARLHIPGANLKGRFVSVDTRKAVAEHVAAHQNGTAVKSNGKSNGHANGVKSTRFGDYSLSVREAGISEEEAHDQYIRHPLRAAVESITSDEWIVISQSGAGHRVKDGKVIRQGRANPFNLDGNQRRVARIMSGTATNRTGEASKITARVRLVACDIAANLQAAGKL